MTEYNLEGRKYTKIYIDNELYLIDSESELLNPQDNVFDFSNSLDKNEFALFKEEKDKTEKIILNCPDNLSNVKKENIKKFIIKEESNSTQFTNKKTKRGRERKIKENENENKKEKFHDKNTSDNLIRKIQVHYLSFVVSYLNDILNNLNYSIQFLNLNYKFKRNIKRDFFQSLKKKTIGEIISNEISIKYKGKEKNFNKNLYEQIKDNEVLNKIFEDNYIKLFRKIYYKSKEKINLKEYGLNKDIYLSKNVKMLNNLLTNDIEYNKKIKEKIIKNFLSDSLFLLK